MRKIICLLAVWLILVNISAFAQDYPDIFREANALYGEEKYDEAIDKYNTILNGGYENGNLYYNLGNCYFKKGDIPNALLNYEKAKRLSPRDKDIESNYEFALSRVTGTAAEPKGGIFARILDKVFGGFSLDELSIIITSLYFLTALFIIIGIYLRAGRRYVLSAAFLLALYISSGFISLEDRIDKMGKDAMAMREALDVKFEPFDSSTTYFQLETGDIVRRIGKENGWVKIKRRDGKAGWVKNEFLKPIS